MSLKLENEKCALLFTNIEKALKEHTILLILLRVTSFYILLVSYLYLSCGLQYRYWIVSEPGRSESDVFHAVVSFPVSTKKICKYYYNEISETSATNRRPHHTIILANIRIRTFSVIKSMLYLLLVSA